MIIKRLFLQLHSSGPPEKKGRFMKKQFIVITVVVAALIVSLFSTFLHADTSTAGDDLAGAWRGKVQLTSGAFADFKDLEFMYSFNAGGTMTESSNYDSYPPGPPAYGVWKKTGVRQYEAKYMVFMTNADSIIDVITKGGGWVPDGHGVLSEKITLSADGETFDSKIKFEIFDKQGKLTTKGGDGVVKGKRFNF